MQFVAQAKAAMTRPGSHPRTALVVWCVGHHATAAPLLKLRASLLLLPPGSCAAAVGSRSWVGPLSRPRGPAARPSGQVTRKHTGLAAAAPAQPSPGNSRWGRRGLAMMPCLPPFCISLTCLSITFGRFHVFNLCLGYIQCQRVWMDIL
eukprot:1160701-Pelagomonas_calceolata.AAC.14